jgi:hypothetical protein
VAFTQTYDEYVGSVTDIGISKAVEDKISKKIRGRFPFYESNFYNKVLTIVMNYLSEYSTLGVFSVSTPDSKKAIEKAFMFLTTEDRDCFLTSIRSITSSDYKYFSSVPDDDSTIS